MKQDNILNIFPVKLSTFKVFIPIFFSLMCFSTVVDPEQLGSPTSATDAPAQTKKDNSLVLPDIGKKPIKYLDLAPSERENLRKQVRAQIQIQAILDLCTINSLPKQISHIENTFENFRALEEYSDKIDLLTYNHIYYSLFGTYIDVFWEYLSSEYRMSNIADEFLLQYRVMYNLPDRGGPEYIQHDWARDIYKGLFCLAKGHPPQESTAIKSQK